MERLTDRDCRKICPGGARPTEIALEMVDKNDMVMADLAEASQSRKFASTANNTTFESDCGDETKHERAGGRGRT